jgi:hypothetical protein
MSSNPSGIGPPFVGLASPSLRELHQSVEITVGVNLDLCDADLRRLKAIAAMTNDPAMHRAITLFEEVNRRAKLQAEKAERERENRLAQQLDGDPLL